MRLTEPLELYRYHARFQDQMAEHDYTNVFLKILRDLESVEEDPRGLKRVLDLGCGQRFPLALLFAAQGSTVTALDINYVQPRPLGRYVAANLRQGGSARTAKSVLRRLMFDRRYCAALSQFAGLDVISHVQDVSFVVADPHGRSYPLDDEQFDLVVSNAVVEHVADVPAMARELARVLRPGGYYHGLIHNFYSLSGGHNMQWAYPDASPPRTVPPWDHLRENRFPTDVHLNRLRPEQYEAAFREALDVLVFEPRDANHDPDGTEGERFLTPDVEHELRGYPRELLLTRAYCAVCRKAPA